MQDQSVYWALKDSGLNKRELDFLLQTARIAAEGGGKILMEHYGRINSIESKSNEGDLVTNADIESEEYLLKYLQDKTPNIKIHAEESGFIGEQSELMWCIDPLDGTTNYAHGYPFFATSVGLTWKNIPLLGAISVPYMKEIFWGAPNIGVFCNNKAITASSCKTLSSSLLVTGFAYDRHGRLDNNYAEFCRLTHLTRGVRRGGAAAVDLAFVAAGRLDGYWERGLSPWDLAAGVALVELAGGVIGDYKGGSFNLSNGRVLACSRGIENELRGQLEATRPLKGHQFGAPELDSIGS